MAPKLPLIFVVVCEYDNLLFLSFYWDQNKYRWILLKSWKFSQNSLLEKYICMGSVQERLGRELTYHRCSAKATFPELLILTSVEISW